MEIIFQKYLSAFSKLKQGVTKYGLAPHKPILLLSVLQMFNAKLIRENKIFISPELIFLFKNNWQRLVKTQHVCTFALPFFHLSREKSKLWRLVPKAGFEAILNVKESVSSITELNQMIDYATFPQDLFDLIVNENYNLMLQQMIKDQYFDTTDFEINSFQFDEIKTLEYKILNEDAALYKTEIKKFIEQKNEEEIFIRGNIFKREIPKIYNNTCCISDMRVDAIANISMIDACHIVPFSESYDDTVTNGIALCPNLHRAFDRGLIGVNEQYKVVVSKVFKEQETGYSIKQFEHKKIFLPTEKKYWPSINNFNRHFQQTFKK